MIKYRIFCALLSSRVQNTRNKNNLKEKQIKNVFLAGKNKNL